MPLYNRQQNQKEIHTATTNTLAEWKAPEFTKHEKSSNWLGLWLIISITSVALAIIFQNFLLAIFLAMAAIMVFLHGFKDPKIIKFTITPHGLYIDDKFIPYRDIHSFWILYEPPEIKELLLKTKRFSIAQLTIPIGPENPVKIRQALIDFVPEKEQQLSLTDIIARWMRF